MRRSVMGSKTATSSPVSRLMRMPTCCPVAMSHMRMSRRSPTSTARELIVRRV